MIVKYLQRFRFSITLSTTSDLASRPQRDIRPVVASNTKQAEITIARSTKKRAEPIFNEVCFLRIIARMSVPPPEASRLKKMAAAKEGSTMAKIISSTGSFVKGFSIGKRISAPHSKTEVRRLT